MIRPGDMVRMTGALPLHGVVRKTSREGLTRGHLLICPVCGANPGQREVLVKDVNAHWRLVKGRG